MTHSLSQGLRARALRGGGYLAVRHGLGLIVGVTGIGILTTLLGPATWGAYAGALGLTGVVWFWGKWGLDLVLVRSETLEADDRHQASSVLLLSGIVSGVVGAIAVPFLESPLGLPGLSLAGRAAFAVLPIMLVQVVPIALLERELAFRQVAAVELTGRVAYFSTALPLAVHGYGLWAPIAGLWTEQLWVAIWAHALARHRPRPVWSWSRVTELCAPGVAFSGSLWLYKLRDLVNPVIVGHFLGAEAVGLIALAIRIVETLGFVRGAAWRVALSALAKVQRDPARARRAIEEGAQIGVMGTALPLVIGVWLAPTAVPLLLGPEWADLVEPLRWIALAAVVNSLFSLQSAALYTTGHNGQVALYHGVQTLLFAACVLLLADRYGVIAYGLGEAAAFASYAIVHFFVVRRFGHPTLTVALAWTLASAVGLLIPGPAKLLALCILIWPPTWKSVRGFLR